MFPVPSDNIKRSPKRQRREFPEDAQRELAESIQKNQLLHPIVVRKPREGEEGPWVLVAGERRLRAIQDYIFALGGQFECNSKIHMAPLVPCVSLGDLDSLAAEEAELEENIRRVDLTWQEEDAAIARLAALRTKQAETRGVPPPSTADIAEEVHGRREGTLNTEVRRAIILAEHLANPDIARAKTREDAWKALKRQEEAKRNALLAEKVGLTYTTDLLSVIHEDCVTWMAGQASEQFDVICTDPQYGIDAQDFGDAGGRLLNKHDYDDSVETWSGLMIACAPLWYRLAKADAHLYVCCDIDNFVPLKVMLNAAGWRCHRTPIINYKVDGNRVPWPGQGPQRKWEMVLYAVKGNKPTTGIYPDVIETRGDINLGHGAQKPVALYVDLLRRSVLPGESVLDSFCGSGPVFPAAYSLRVRATGVEKESVAYGIAVKRIQQLKEEK